ncbi:uncharacterized protein LOC128181982 [Crassostrea angulata]|uniref:uncharacterized protein LOC128181982 n=1 Tax=Magallana angulata TaxID=2784310 RepID=UPI0022B20CC9|nr:uncharacterized protein LOC128181982 [Crassostrea angulata]
MYISYILQLTLLEAMTSISVSQNPGICSNVSDGEPLECCPNYRLVGSSCQECFAGSRGVNCAEDCAHGFYGRLCRERCSCDPCNKVYGCQNASIGIKYSTTAEQDPTRYHWLSMLALSSGGFAICFILCLTIVCIFRWNMTTRTFILPKHGTPHDNLPDICRYNPLQRLSKVEASDANSREKVYQINSCQTVGPFVMTKANKTDFQDVYGHIDPMEGCYNILKLKVLEEKDVAYVSKSCVSLQNENYYMKAENTIYTTTSKI